ncbi:MAG: hypothetical protein LBS17_02035 [Actinomycetes bacterium]|jgi:O-antigen ligase|nr:hypothetical protein [Actinomycetes bacterium]
MTMLPALVSKLAGTVIRKQIVSSAMVPTSSSIATKRQTARKTPAPGLATHRTALLLVLGLLAPGSWFFYRLPDKPFAQLSFCVFAAIAILLAVFFPTHAKPDKLSTVLLLALALFLVAVAISFLANPWPFQVALYDMYGDMPLILWVVFPFILMVATAFPFTGTTENLKIPAVAVCLFTFLGVLTRVTTGMSSVFGSPAYAVPALAPLLPFLMVTMLGRSQRRSINSALVWWMGGLLFVVAFSFSQGMLGLVTMVFGLLVMGAFAQQLGIRDRFARVIVRCSMVLIACVVLGIVVASIPSLRSFLLNRGDYLRLDSSLSSRLFLWDAAARMFATKPLFGFGSAGFQYSSYRFYDSSIYTLTSTLGSDPTVFSSPSPHALFWDILTRLGAFGAIAALVLAMTWVTVFVRRLSADKGNAQATLFRIVCFAGTLTWLFSLMLTPFHYAMGFAGVAMAAIAVAPPLRQEPTIQHADRRKRTGQIALAAACTICAILLVGFGGWKAVGLSAGDKTYATAEQNYRQQLVAQRIMPDNPLTERRLLELGIMISADNTQLHAAQTAVDCAPGYIRDYLPNAARFALLSLQDAQISNRTDFVWEKRMLADARSAGVEFPSITTAEALLAQLSAANSAAQQPQK